MGTLAGLDANGRPSLRGIIPSRGSSKRFHAPRREHISNRVIKSWEKVKTCKRWRRSRPSVRIQGFVSSRLGDEESTGVEGVSECSNGSEKNAESLQSSTAGILFVGGLKVMA